MFRVVQLRTTLIISPTLNVKNLLSTNKNRDETVVSNQPKNDDLCLILLVEKGLSKYIFMNRYA